MSETQRPSDRLQGLPFLGSVVWKQTLKRVGMAEHGDSSKTMPERGREARTDSPVPVLLVVGGAGRDRMSQRRVVRLPPALTIARGPENAQEDADQPASVLLIPDPLLSREHLRIVETGTDSGVFDVEDLASLNGVFLDGRRLAQEQPARLTDGCLLSFGGHAAVFRRVSEAALAAVDESRVWPLGPVATVSPSLSLTLAAVRRLARTDAELLLLGETGVGKEILARAIHHASGRTGRFVGINCAAIPIELAETELFGSVRGAHSTATEAKQGLVQSAEGGTLFLDEIGDMEPRLQTKVLRFLQEREVTPVGATTSRRVDVKIVAATSALEGGNGAKLREDLLARLGAEPVLIPPLRHRIEDLGALTAHFAGASGADFEPEAFRALCLYAWPRNIRELEMVVKRALALAEGKRIGLEHLPVAVRESVARGAPIEAPRRRPRGGPSRTELEALLGKHKGNITAVAVELDRQWNVVWRWMIRHELRPERFRS